MRTYRWGGELAVRAPNGDKLTVDSKSGAVAELPVREADAKLERASFSYSEKDGEWVEEGKATRTVNDRGDKVYRVASRTSPGGRTATSSRSLRV